MTYKATGEPRGAGLEAEMIRREFRAVEVGMSEIATSGSGSVDSVTATPPIYSSGGANPVISISAATTSAAGSMSAADKTKLDGVAVGANNYTHPATHPPSIIVQDSSNRFVTDTEKTTWNAKLDASSYTASDVLTKIKTVDGTGSGLDADTLDGSHASAFQPVNNELTALSSLADTAGFVKKTGDGAYSIDTSTYSTTAHNHTGTYEPANANIQSHISSTSNPHSVTAAQVGAMSTSHAANSITGFGASGVATTVSRSDHDHSGVYQPVNNELTAIAALADTAGFVKKTGDGAYSIDTTGYAPLNSPSLTGAPSAPTATAGTNTTQIATTAFVQSAVSGSVSGVSSFNTRTGAVTLTSGDVTGALTYTPLDSASYTASDVLTKIKTVDGTGSGLDADTLDGNDSTAFATAGHNHTGTYQPLDADLTAIAALSGTGFAKRTAADTWALESPGMVLLGTLNTTSGASQMLSSLTLTNYKRIFCSWDGASHSSSSATTYQLDGKTLFVSGTSAQANTYSMHIWIDLANGTYSCIEGRDNTGACAAGKTGYSTASTSLVFAVSTGNFDGGTIRVYGES